MKVERNILSKENLAELENLVNRLDDAAVEALESMLKRRDEEKRREALRNELLAAHK